MLPPNIPRAMKANIRRRTVWIKSDAQWRRMCWEAQFRRDAVRTRCIAVCANRKLRPHFDVRVVRDHGRVPSGEAVGVAVVCAGFGRRRVEGAVVVEFLARICIVNVDVVLGEVVHAILNGPLGARLAPAKQHSHCKSRKTHDTTRYRILRHPNTVPQPPSQHSPSRIRHTRLTRLRNAKGAELTPPVRDL